MQPDVLQYIKCTIMVSVLSDMETFLRTYSTFPISNAFGERPSSILKRVNYYLRNSLSQWKLNSYAISFIEQDSLDNTNNDKIIDNFAESRLENRFLKNKMCSYFIHTNKFINKLF